jgi:LmbE family N-acetylglucosaminyl deacetylase
MSMTKSEAGRLGARAYMESTTPEQRAESARRARRALAVREIVDGWPELDEETQQRLRSLLRLLRPRAI